MKSSLRQTDADMRDPEQDAPLHRRWLAKIGLQGKLILSFMYLLILALGVSLAKVKTDIFRAREALRKYLKRADASR